MTGKNGQYARPEKPIKNLDTLIAEAPIVNAVNQCGGYGEFYQILGYAATVADSGQILKIYNCFWEWWEQSLRTGVELYREGKLDV